MVCTALLAVALLVGILVRMPWTLKLDARGQLLPEERCWLFAPVEAQVVRFEPGVQPGCCVAENQALVLMYDLQLEIKLQQLASEMATAQEEINALARQQEGGASEAERVRLSGEKRQREFVRNRKAQELQALRERTHADAARPGYFWLQAPMRGTVLTWDFREKFVNRTVKPDEPLVRLGNKDNRWEIELKIPHGHISPVVQAFGLEAARAELDVEFVLASAPTRTFRGKLERSRLAGEALPPAENHGETEPVVMASVRIDGPDIPTAVRVPPELLVTGTEVHAKITSGERSLGYCLFHGLWEFFFEKIAFLWF
jgi:hypothetical protein